jgi:hypothetical protein
MHSNGGAVHGALPAIPYGLEKMGRISAPVVLERASMEMICYKRNVDSLHFRRRSTTSGFLAARIAQFVDQ